MSHKNHYTNYSKKFNEEKVELTASAIDLEEEAVVADCVEMEPAATFAEPLEGQTSIPEIEPEVAAEPEPEEKPRKFGRVVDCVKLNVRKMPNRNSDVLAEVKAGSEVMIDEENSTYEFYKVCTESGIEGYCMKNFIKA